ncbi:tetratricopeptide repeat protein [Sphingomonas sp.]|uniref:tetratricopeptide repeat protein n=1 Tax=Sphingomonas sp. TaxID=28214 RepID=UPI001EC7B9B6|nr:tetratricopeptide repeat protein [Sphingomonas sp.]MBX3593307.1 tetratricopeptide repeat protein [Sphingomonas sp.]
MVLASLIALVTLPVPVDEIPAAPDRADALEAAGRYRVAEPIRRRAVEEAGTGESETAAAAAEKLGNNLAMQSRTAEAEPFLRTALEIRLHLAAIDRPPSPEVQARAASSLNQFSAVLLEKGELKEAEAMARRAMWIYRRADRVRDPAYAATLTNLGSIIAAGGNYVRADSLFREAANIMEKVARRGGWQGSAADPARLDAEQRALAFQQAVTLNNLGVNLHRIATGATLPTLFRQSYFSRNAVLAPTTWSPSDASMAMDSATRGDMLAEADNWLRDSLHLREKLRGRRHPDTANAMNSLAANLLAQERRGEAESLYREAVSIKRAFLPASDRDLIVGHWALARIVSDRAESRSYYRKAGDGILAGQALFREFDQAARSQLRSYGPVFTGHVRVDWDLAGQRD